MGSQIYFVHTEADIPSFLSVLEAENGLILFQGSAFSPEYLESEILRQMCTDRGKFDIVLSNKPYQGVLSGSGIEFLNCSKGNPLSRTYEVGRLYMCKQDSGEYDQNIYALYKKLCMYIKKHYVYSKDSKIYFSQTFLSKYNHHVLHVTRLGRPIRF